MSMVKFLLFEDIVIGVRALNIDVSSENDLMLQKLNSTYIAQTQNYQEPSLIKEPSPQNKPWRQQKEEQNKCKHKQPEHLHLVRDFLLWPYTRFRNFPLTT